MIFFLESDANKDRLISYDEFLTETKKDEFDEDPGWETMDMQVNIFYRAMFCLLATLIYICDQKLKHAAQWPKILYSSNKIRNAQNEHLNSL